MAGDLLATNAALQSESCMLKVGGPSLAPQGSSGLGSPVEVGFPGLSLRDNPQAPSSFLSALALLEPGWLVDCWLSLSPA